MNIVRMKRGVVMMGTSPCLFEIIFAAKHAYFKHDRDVVITSACDGTHRINSIHYELEALDLRTNHLTDHQRVEIMYDMQKQLGDQYRVLFEGDHFHVERIQ